MGITSHLKSTLLNEDFDTKFKDHRIKLLGNMILLLILSKVWTLLKLVVELIAGHDSDLLNLNLTEKNFTGGILLTIHSQSLAILILLIAKRLNKTDKESFNMGRNLTMTIACLLDIPVIQLLALNDFKLMFGSTSILINSVAMIILPLLSCKLIWTSFIMILVLFANIQVQFLIFQPDETSLLIDTVFCLGLLTALISCVHLMLKACTTDITQTDQDAHKAEATFSERKSEELLEIFRTLPDGLMMVKVQKSRIQSPPDEAPPDEALADEAPADKDLEMNVSRNQEEAAKVITQDMKIQFINNEMTRIFNLIKSSEQDSDRSMSHRT